MPSDAAPQRPADRDFGTIGLCILFILLGGWMVVESSRMSALGSVFPRTIAAVMILCSVILLFRQLMGADRSVSEESASGSTGRRVALITIMGAWILLIPMIGFFATSLIAFIALLPVAEYDAWTGRRALAYVLTGLAIVLGFYFLFVELLLVPTPRGMLF